MNPRLINIVVPVYNEEGVLAESLGELTAFLAGDCPYPCELVIADNGSTDSTLEIAHGLAAQYASVSVLHLDQQGRGGAVKRAWSQSQAEVLSYMDVDLSTDLEAFPTLIEALISGGNDIATGSRLLDPALTERSFKRELISRAYNLLVRSMFHTRFSDAQCGFKAITRQAARELLPLVEDNAWFMDTELFVIAEKLGYRIFDLPVRWVEEPNSRVRLWRTAWEDIKGLLRVRHGFACRKYHRPSELLSERLCSKSD
ncbi:MAG: dolichyl-phosphate beta-glucosyltransferase [Verrucomicrobiota bacterium]|jgi:glycosyltransferase involved in cell wall biosynthesis